MVGVLGIGFQGLEVVDDAFAPHQTEMLKAKNGLGHLLLSTLFAFWLSPFQLHVLHGHWIEVRHQAALCGTGHGPLHHF